MGLLAGRQTLAHARLASPGTRETTARPPARALPPQFRQGMGAMALFTASMAAQSAEPLDRVRAHAARNMRGSTARTKSRIRALRPWTLARTGVTALFIASTAAQ